jgi:hypothetical protein
LLYLFHSRSIALSVEDQHMRPSFESPESGPADDLTTAQGSRFFNPNYSEFCTGADKITRQTPHKCSANGGITRFMPWMILPQARQNPGLRSSEVGVPRERLKGLSTPERLTHRFAHRVWLSRRIPEYQARRLLIGLTAPEDKSVANTREREDQHVSRDTSTSRLEEALCRQAISSTA